ncbi:MAG TPA: glycerol-3-phosphate 1-O-acyltransferase PlsY [Ktedonobacterales bacterium]|nr:glycerol-3-phosphate 1-O-acyltransferase PlsY [Ktedonobacterales bacterium]
MSLAEIIGRLIAATVAGYLLGSIPTGVLVSKLAGKGDPRAAGSGKTGATNVLRTLGLGPAAVVVLVDVVKGIAAVLLARYVFFGGVHPMGMSAFVYSTLRDSAEAAAAFAAVLGHNYSIFIRFSGGRGVLTGAGAMVTMSPLTTLFAFVAAVTPIALTRYVSLGSIMGAVMSMLAEITLTVLHVDSVPHMVFIVVASLVVIVSHRDNIDRLRDGTERKLGQSAQPQPAQSAPAPQMPPVQQTAKVAQ